MIFNTKGKMSAEMMKGDKNTFSSHDLGDTNAVTKAQIRKLFRDSQIEAMGGKCLLAVSKDIVGMILEEVRLCLLTLSA